MGFVPMGAWGGDVALNRAKEYCPAFLCAIVQSLLELGINGAYEGASAIVIPSLCDTLKTVGENWKYAVPSIPFIPMTYPQNRKPAYGVAYTKAGYERVIRDLEKLGGALSEEKLLASIKVYNRHNAAMRKIDELLAVHPEITAAQRSDIFKSAFFMTKEEHTDLVEALIEEAGSQDSRRGEAAHRHLRYPDGRPGAERHSGRNGSAHRGRRRGRPVPPVPHRRTGAR